ncbi:DNA polymerase I [Sulfoacidibacillus thermotolerans]|uniref:DNA polymerase I n=1 Tax=Sulfoacidibacillus thermotolerans TaxID=1765684 RepID=UPI001FE74DDB|nr:DNA polymerase I [Sulfoacidibacillus thermotolerans]
MAVLDEQAPKHKLLLIDGNSVLYRAFYGVPLLSTSSGQYTNAIYGFSMMLLKLLQDEQPSHVAVAFDKGKETFRHAFFEEYKGKRQSTPPELIGQFPMARELLRSFGIVTLEKEQYEADDIIGTLATKASMAGFEVFAVSGDKDLFQLVSEQVTAGMTRKGTTDIVRYDPAAVRDRYHLSPQQMIDLKGLMGDSSDNIPGVPGVGEKTAIKLLAQFGTLEEVFEHIGDVTGAKLQERLREHRELALLSKRLATIDRAVPLDVTLDELLYEGYDVASVREAFRMYEFRSLLSRVEGVDQGAANEQQMVQEAQNTSSPTVFAQIEKEQIVELSHLQDLLPQLGERCALLFDLQGDYQTGEWRGMAVAGAHAAFYVPLSEQNLQNEQIRAQLMTFLRHERVTKIVYDAKAIMVHGVSLGLASDVTNVVGPLFDTLLATYLIHTSEGEPSLLDVIEKATESSAADADRLVPSWVRQAIEKGGENRSRALIYCAAQLFNRFSALQADLVQYQLQSLYEDLELPLAAVLAELELYGVKVDTERLRQIGKELAEGIDQLTKQIYLLAGTEFNINSPKQLGEILFDKMGLPPVKKTKTGYSTSADVLEKLAPHSEIVTHILQYRQLTKLQSTYVEGLLRVVRQPQSRVHTSFHQAMTATGRLSSADPNLQNIPIRMEEGRKLRLAFVPTYREWVIVSADYSQVELRILAHLSQDQALIDAFLADMDIHTRTASDVFEVPLDQVTSLMRRQAKAVNFGIVYGISDYGLSQNLNISRAQAGEFIAQYFAKFPGVKRYMEESIQKARELGYTETLLGRRRYLPQIHSRNFNERSFAERTAMNTPIQGTAADVIKLAMVKLAQELKVRGFQGKMLLQVHDELILECPMEELTLLSELVREQMEHAVVMSVPLKVDVHYGSTWYDAK